ncbi:helix-turn-helix transcriptional regulator [Aquabacterium sp. J223]|uniref:helix-turn-helix transcriptional regulator n=1 Tax=Aquabacterium sp. J223 TaxID=2898431 RepID=UPI0021AE1F12|nr:helix-turn-helix transcriptional regulator [Aquabacterium sp. J223]UUX97172.1 helix-turn-helix transcriptional regulator [Aquabacterium sp. J223]
MLDHDRLLDLQRTLLEGEGQDGALERFLEKARHAFDANAAALFSPQPVGAQDVQFMSQGLAAEQLSSIAQWTHHDPWIKRRQALGLRMDIGLIAMGSSYLAPQELRRTEFYGECGRQAGVFHIGTAVIDDGTRPGGLPRVHFTLVRPEDRHDFDTDTTAKALQLLAPAVRASLLVRRNRAWQAESKAGVITALDAHPVPTFVLAADGEVLFANAAARELMRRTNWLTVAAGRLRRVFQLNAHALSAAFTSCAANGTARIGLWALDGQAIATGELLMTHSTDDRLRTLWPALSHVVSVAVDQPAQAEDRLLAVAQAYGLSKAEQAVLRLLRDGHPPDQVAIRLGVKVSTVRTHISQLLAKSGVHRVQDVLALCSRR